MSEQRTVVVLGATGQTGRQVVAQGLARGHRVVAPVRSVASLPGRPGLTVLAWPDVTDVAVLTQAVDRADAVISVLGGAAKGPTTVCTDATASLVPAMSRAGVLRLVVLSAHGVAESRDRSLYSRAVWAGVRHRLRDKEGMESLIVSSDLDWTLVRAPALKNTDAAGAYRHGEDVRVRLTSSVSRADLAGFMLDEIEATQYVHGRPRVVGW